MDGEDKVRVVLLGPPGAGKGTQAKRIQERFGVPHISTGDLLRTAVAEDTELGRSAKSFMDRGQLVPDGMVVDMLGVRVGQPDAHTGFLLDGFPRTIAQAAILERMLSDTGVRLDQVLRLAVPREELIKRLSSRRTCRECGRMYHPDFNPPAKPGVCTHCGGELYQREDDREETVRARLEVYDRETAPVEDYYRERGLLRVVDGTGSADVVATRLRALLNGKP